MCRRDGVFANAKGEFNFAHDLLTPFLKRVDGNWSAVFSTVVKQYFTESASKCSEAIEKFSADFASIMSEQYAIPVAVGMFDQQVVRFAQCLGESLKAARRQISKEQKQANRLFEETVREDLRATYAPCVQKRGTGSYVRIEALMRGHVESIKDNMFSTATETVRIELELMLHNVNEALEKNVKQSCEAFKRDCLYLISSSGRDFETLDQNIQHHVLASLSNCRDRVECESVSTGASC